MPRETISLDDYPFDVVVGWGNSQNQVQVATVAGGSPNGAERIVECVNQWLENAGMPLVNYEELRRRINNPPYFEGWYASLTDRRAVNDLIRLLQRARDGAFGKDA